MSLRSFQLTYFLGIDAGGTALKAAIYDETGQEIQASRIRCHNIHPYPGFVERDPEQMWNSVASVVRSAIESAQISGDDIACVAATGFGCGIFLLDGDGRPTRNAIVSSDMRSQSTVDALRSDDRFSQLQKMAMQRQRAGTTVALLDWFEQNEPELTDQARHVLLCKDYINFRLTGEISTDITDSTGALLASPATHQVNGVLFDNMKLQQWVNKIPKIYPSTDIVGQISASAAEQTGLAQGTPVAVGCMDVHAVSLASNTIDSSVLGICLGTWGINYRILDNPELDPPYALMQMARGIDQSCLVMEGRPDSVTNLDWFLNLLGGEVHDHSIVSRACSDSVMESTKLVYLPHLKGGKGLPKGGFVGFGSETTKEQLVCAVMEGVAFQHVDDIERLYSVNHDAPKSARIVGGAAQSDEWVQLFADCLNLSVETVCATEQGALGAAIIAATALGVFPSQNAASAAMTGIKKKFQPNADRFRNYSKKRERYRRVQEALSDLWKTY